MKKSLLLTIAFIAIIMVLISACGSTSSPSSTDALTDAEMQALVDEKCSKCHTVDRVYDNSFSESRWSTIFDSMIAKGAQVSDEEKVLMIEWLVANQ